MQSAQFHALTFNKHSSFGAGGVKRSGMSHPKGFLLRLILALTLNSSVAAHSQQRVIINGLYIDKIDNKQVSVAKFYMRNRLIVPNYIKEAGQVTQIGAEAAKLRYWVREVDWPEGIRYIGNEAFAYCVSLTTFIVRAETPPELGKDVFSHTDISKCTLVVPAGCSTKYKDYDIWNQFGTIREIGQE